MWPARYLGCDRCAAGFPGLGYDWIQMPHHQKRIVIWLAAVGATLLAQIAVLVALDPSRRIIVSVPLAAAVAMVLGGAALLVHAPVLAILGRAETIGPLAAGAVCAALFPLAQIALWLIVRESGETLGNLVDAFRRFPGEILVTGAPLALGGFVFGALTASRRASG